MYCTTCHTGFEVFANKKNADGSLKVLPSTCEACQGIERENRYLLGRGKRAVVVHDLPRKTLNDMRAKASNPRTWPDFKLTVG